MAERYRLPTVDTTADIIALYPSSQLRYRICYMDNELTRFSRVFQDEDALRKSIASLFRHRPEVSGVEITHGPLERGKDIVFYVSDPVGERNLYACVVKHGRLTA